MPDISMTPPPTATLLPGLHGTGELYAELSAHLPLPCETVSYPTKAKQQSYKKLGQWLNDHVDWSIPRVLIAESFSGPLALQMAAEHGESVQAVVLAATFCHAPISAGLAMLPLRPLFMMQPPRAAIRHFLVGKSADSDIVTQVQKVVKNISSHTLSSRVRSIIELEGNDAPRLPDLPMLILQAQNDTLVPWEVQNQLEHLYPKAKVNWLESAHLIFQLAPEEAAKCINDFLAPILTSQAVSS